jgi:hypothetical protein
MIERTPFFKGKFRPRITPDETAASSPTQPALTVGRGHRRRSREANYGSVFFTVVILRIQLR